MAYLRKEKETVEVDFPISKVWDALEKAVKSIEWTVEEGNESKHELKIKTKANFMAYASIITANVTAANENTTRVTLSAETPVTTITGIVDFGRTSERINTFLLALVKQLKPDSSDHKEQNNSE